MKPVVFGTLLVGWMTYYFCQRTLPSAMTTMIKVTPNYLSSHSDEYSSSQDGFTKAFIGQLQSLFAVAYSISYLVSGIMSDIVNVKIMFFTGLALSGILVALFPLTEGSRALGILVYICFGLCQGCGWPATARILRQMYSPSELGSAWGILSTGSSIASIFSPFLVLSISSTYGWKYSFFITGVAAICFSFVVLVAIEGKKTTFGDAGKVSDTSQNSNSTSRWFTVLGFQNLWVVMAMQSVLWIVAASILDWGQLYLMQTHGLTKDSAGLCSQIDIVCCTHHSSTITFSFDP